MGFGIDISTRIAVYVATILTYGAYQPTQHGAASRKVTDTSES